MKYLYTLFASLLASASLFAQVEAGDSITVKNPDGPYIFNTKDGMRIIQGTDQGIDMKVYGEDFRKVPFTVTSHDGTHKFDVKLHTIDRPAWNYAQPDSMLIISDPHANLNAFISVLKSQKVIDENYRWNFGKNHLMIIGDVFDRENDVLPIFWLIYKLEDEAKAAGGAVHFLLGNHEEMVLWNDVRYTNGKYKDLALVTDTKHSDMWTEESELGKWLHTRNTIEVIGDNLFVHAGLSKEFGEQNWDIAQMNDTISSYLGMPKKERLEHPNAKFLFTSNGPLWYRGMVKTDEKSNPIADEDVLKLLKQYDVNRIYVGHTIFPDVSVFYKGKVIAVNVNNQKNMDAGRSRGVLVTPKGQFLVYDDPSKTTKLKY